MVTRTQQHPERLDPAEHDADLMVSEHRGRYVWAGHLARNVKVLDAGCGTGYGLQILERAGASRVVGVDISPEAVSQAAKLNPSDRVEIFEHDLRTLPFSDGEFDLVVCFEVIEHVEDRDSILDELARVLAERGILCISTPNRRVYPAGNPYHVYEYEPEEFAGLLGRRFPHVVLYRQTAWLTSAILSDRDAAAFEFAESLSPRTIKTEAKSPGEETFTIALAGRDDLPAVPSVVTLGEPFEVRWWESQLDTAGNERAQERMRYRDEQAERERDSKEQGQALLKVESELAGAQDEIARLKATHEDLKRWARERRRALTEEARKFEERLWHSERDRRDFENRLRRAEGTIDDITGSISWRMTAPLRGLKRLLAGR